MKPWGKKGGRKRLTPEAKSMTLAGASKSKRGWWSLGLAPALYTGTNRSTSYTDAQSPRTPCEAPWCLRVCLCGDGPVWMIREAALTVPHLTGTND